MLKDFLLPRWYFRNAGLSSPGDDVKFQLHWLRDASNLAFYSVICLRRLVNGIPAVFVFGKCNIVLANQSSWLINRKELVAALNTVKLIKQASDAVEIPNCSNFFFRCNFRTELQWFKNPDLRLDKFITPESITF